ncbi:DnaJ domain-containing protein [Phenylobacterium sp.]|uniref:DnaJ domain-containing protein n=1 Tax=Phenylobacterium sp. TaxID=1871053 RepID=UPI002F40A340
MNAKSFISYYQILELGPNASPRTIARKFRYLASRYHPDNQTTGDRSKFDLVLAAYEVLKDEFKRAKYHDENRDHLPPPSHSFDEDLDGSDAEEDSENENIFNEDEQFIDNIGVDKDISIQNNLLTMLYFQRRRNIRRPGIGNAELEYLSGCPHEHLEFHIWYLKEKGWISTGEDGLLSITVAGVDRAALISQGEGGRKLIVDQS